MARSKPLSSCILDASGKKVAVNLADHMPETAKKCRWKLVLVNLFYQVTWCSYHSKRYSFISSVHIGWTSVLLHRLARENLYWPEAQFESHWRLSFVNSEVWAWHNTPWLLLPCFAIEEETTWLNHAVATTTESPQRNLLTATQKTAKRLILGKELQLSDQPQLQLSLENYEPQNKFVVNMKEGLEQAHKALRQQQLKIRQND